MKLQKPKHISQEVYEIEKEKALFSINILFALVEVIDYYQTDLESSLSKIHGNKFFFKKQVLNLQKQINWFKDFAISAFGSEEEATGFFDLTDKVYYALQAHLKQYQKQ